jgi:hypothetical protein
VLQLGSLTQFERAFALLIVVEWRISRLMRLGRTCPGLGAEVFVDSDEIQAAYLLRKENHQPSHVREIFCAKSPAFADFFCSKERWRAWRRNELG